MTSRVYSSIKSENTYGKVYSVLKNSNIDNYIQLVSSEEVLSKKISSSVSTHIKSKKEFYELTAYLFQSLTNIGYTTYESIEFICETLNSGIFTKTERNKIIDFLKDSFCFVHTDYTIVRNGLWKNKKNHDIILKLLFGHDNVDHFNMGLVLGGSAATIIGAKKQFKRDIKTLSAFTGVNTTGLNNAGIYKNLLSAFKLRSLNNDIKNPTKTNTSVSSILISNPDIRIGTQNSLQLATFFNSLTTLEMNRSYPYLNATFILPNLSSQKYMGKDKKGKKRFKTISTSSSINSFLFGDISNKTKNYDGMSGDYVRKGVVKTNMSIFTSPQTMVNMDEDIGHSQNNPNSSGNRRTTVHDPTQPFMTIKSFSINASATKGLMSYKSGKLSVVLHDRTRMNDIAPFVKPDLLGEFGAEIVLEYGWSNPDEENPENPLGYFIGNSRVTEKYMIVNSSLSMDNSGQVNIDLSIAMKGPYEFKNQQISTRVKGRILATEFSEAVGDLDYHRNLLFASASNEYFENSGINTKNFKDLFRETSRLTPPQITALGNFKTPHDLLYNSIAGNFQKHLTITSTTTAATASAAGGKAALKFSFSTTTLLPSVLETFCTLITNKPLTDVQKAISAAKTAGTNVDFIIENKTLKPADAMNTVKSVFDSIFNLSNLIVELTKDDIQEGDNEKAVLESIMGSINYIDHFYPTNQKLYPKKNPTNYVSLGSVINTIVQHYVAKVKGKSTSQFDEIQTIFYTANEHAAAMANESIAKFLIDRKMLGDFLVDIFQKRTVISPESLISQIIDKFVQVKDNITLGMSDLYEPRNRDYKKAVEISKSIANTNTFKSQLEATLRKIYFGPPPSGANVNSSEIKFTMPIIHMNFDCLTSGGLTDKNSERSILRISIYDRANSPFSASSEILQGIYQGNIQKTYGKLLANRRDFKENKRKDKNYERKNLKNFNATQKKEIQKLSKAKWIKINKDGSYSLNLNKITGRSNFKGGIKDIYKEIYPSLTFGTQNSVMISANVSTMNENKLATIFMTKSDRNDQNLINNRISKDLPLVVMPAQASVEIFGCPWVNFGQSVFLDFETGTTLDNKYVVTGITHNLTPGKFTTQLTLSYGDNYGQLKNLEDEINKNSESKKKKTRVRNTKKTVNKISKYVIDPNYLNSQYYNQSIKLLTK